MEVDGYADVSAHVAVADLEWDRFGPAYEARRPRPLIEEVKAGAGSRPSASVRDAATTATPDAVAAQVREEVAA